MHEKPRVYILSETAKSAQKLEIKQETNWGALVPNTAVLKGNTEEQELNSTIRSHSAEP